jgi:hypothetical protein
MALIFEELTLWEVSFRWAGFDPRQLWIRIPLTVRDHFRNVMQAILAEELQCSTLRTEKWQPDCGSDPEFFIRHYIDEVYECIGGIHFDRKLLKWAVIEQAALKKWCRRRGIPLPEFWFPAGSKDFPHEEADQEKDNRFLWGQLFKKRREALFSYHDLSPEDSAREKAWVEIQKMDAELDQLDADYKSLVEHGIVKEDVNTAPKTLRNDQEARIAAQVIARRLWKDNPSMLIAEVVKHDSIQHLCGADHYGEAAVRRWVKQVAPPKVSARRGRPRKNNPTDDRATKD